MRDGLHPDAVTELPQSSRQSPLGLILTMAPLLIVAICVAQATGLFVLPQGLRAGIMFLLLIALMLTGMPVSIALNLTVLAFMFTLTDVRTELARIAHLEIRMMPEGQSRSVRQ